METYHLKSKTYLDLARAKFCDYFLKLLLQLILEKIYNLDTLLVMISA